MAHTENGVSVAVQSVRARGDKTVVEMRIVNGTDDAVDVVRSNDPMLLVGATGEPLSSSEEEVELQPYSASVLTVEFAGTPGDGPLTLMLNSRYGNANSQPKVTVRDIPASGGGTTFASALPAGASIATLSGHHPNGTVVTLDRLGFVRDGIEISFAAVNGNTRDVKLADNEAFLQDPQGNRYYFVPPDANRELTIPAGQKLVGVLRFAGRVAPAAGSLSLHFNDRYGSTSENAPNPKITIANIPVARAAS